MLWRPVAAKLCTRAELSDGTYSLNDLYDFHELLDLQAALQPKE